MRRVAIDSDADKIMQGSGETKSSREDGGDWPTAEHLLEAASLFLLAWLLHGEGRAGKLRLVVECTIHDQLRV
jgi:hypothetical protein